MTSAGESEIGSKQGGSGPREGLDAIARRRAVEKDPLGDRVHAWFGAVALALQPLTPVTGLVGLILLAGYAILRLHATGPCYRTLFRGALVPILIVTLAWTALSISWSPDPAVGLDNLGKYRVALLIFGLWPVVHHARWLICGLAAGCTLNAIVQGLMITEIVADPHFLPVEPGDAISHTGGLTKHPGMTSLFAAVSAVLLLGLGLRRLAAPRIVIPLWLGSITSVALAGNRTVYLALPVALLAAAAQSLRAGGVKRRSIAIAGGFAVAFVVGAVTLTPISERIRILHGEVTRALTSEEFSSSAGARFAWWSMSIPIGSEAPILGHGGGATRDVFRDRIDRVNEDLLLRYGDDAKPVLSTGDPHSTFLRAWVEQGAVGVVLWCAFFVAAFRTSLRVASRDPVWTGLPAAWLLLFAYALTSSITMSTFTMSMLAILVAFTIPRSAHDARVAPSGSEARPAS